MAAEKPPFYIQSYFYQKGRTSEPVPGAAGRTDKTIKIRQPEGAKRKRIQKKWTQQEQIYQLRDIRHPRKICVTFIYTPN